jgi:hypothetical protein
MMPQAYYEPRPYGDYCTVRDSRIKKGRYVIQVNNETCEFYSRKELMEFLNRVHEALLLEK